MSCHFFLIILFSVRNSASEQSSRAVGFAEFSDARSVSAQPHVRPVVQQGQGRQFRAKGDGFAVAQDFEALSFAASQVSLLASFFSLIER